MQHTASLTLANAPDRARQITVRGCGFDPEVTRVTREQQQLFHDTYQNILGELVAALDPETY